MVLKWAPASMNMSVTLELLKQPLCSKQKISVVGSLTQKIWALTNAAITIVKTNMSS